MTARTPVYIDSGKLHVFESGDTLPPWLSPSSMAWENLTGVPAGLTELAALTGPGYAKLDSAGAWSVQAAIPQADVSGLTTALAGLQPISARLTAIAGLTDAAGWLHDDGAGNWALTTPTKSDVGLGSVENTALSTWTGSTNLTTLGTVTSGAWHGTAIADAYIASAAAWNAKEAALGSPSTSGYLLSSTSAGVRSWVAPYILPTATASVLGGVKVGAGLSIASSVLSVSYGTAAGTACAGNDSRLSDSRTPTAHVLDGALHTISGKTAGQVLVATGATTFGFVTVSGDATLSGSGALTLPTLLTAGSAGSATAVPTLTWDAKGRLTAAGSAAISIPHTQINDWATSTTPSAIGALPYLVHSGPVDFNMINGNIPGAYPIFGTTSYSNAPPGLAVNAGGGMLWQGFGANGVDWNAQVFVDAQQDALWYRTESYPATWRSWHQLLTSTSSIPHTQISDWSTATSSFLTANQSISLTGAVTGSGTTSIATSFANTHLAGINQDLATTSSPTFATVTANLTGHASLDIPLTGSTAITGPLVSSNSATFLTVTGTQGISAPFNYGLTLYDSTNGNFTISKALTGYNWSVAIGSNTFATISPTGAYLNFERQVYFDAGAQFNSPLTLGNTFTPTINTLSSNYALSISDQGKVIINNTQGSSSYNITLSNLGSSPFWCFISFTSTFSNTFGPASGTTWYFRGNSRTSPINIPFSGIATWDGTVWIVG